MVKVTLNEKQHHAYKLLTKTNGVNEVLYGGSAGSGKSFLGCLWVLSEALFYPETRWCIARSQITQLKHTTLKTFAEVSKLLKTDYEINNQSNTIFLGNGSEVLLKELSNKPGKDPNFDGLGSLEISGAFVDEIANIPQRGYEVLKSRIRYKMPHGEPKIFASCNPTKNWVKRYFYDKFVNGELETYKTFIQALPTDNKHLPKSYLKSLERMNEADKQRLLHGNWDYADDDAQLFDQNYIKNILKKYKPSSKPEYYISCDVATGKGQDYSVIFVWDNLHIIDWYYANDVEMPQLVVKLIDFVHKYSVNPKHIIVDCDGIGVGINQLLKSKGLNTVPFLANSVPSGKFNYKNFKSQCYFEMSQHQITTHHEELYSILSDELPAILRITTNSGDGRVGVNSKDSQKSLLGHSPDFADTAMMRFNYNVKPKRQVYIAPKTF